MSMDLLQKYIIYTKQYRLISGDKTEDSVIKVSVSH